MLTAHRLRRLLALDPDGNLRWRERTSNRIQINSIAGSDRADGQRKIVIDGSSFLQHRLVTYHQTGKWPAKKRRTA